MAVAVKTECVHYWKLDWWNHGVCKYCGKKKQFPRRGDIDWGDVRRKAIVHGKAERVIIPYNFKEEV